MSGDVFGNGMLLSEHTRLRRGVRPPRTSSSTRTRTPRRRTPSGAGSSTCTRSSWAGLRRELISRRRRCLPPHAEGDPGLATRPARRSASTTSDATLTPAELMRGDPARAGRPALERRHRHVRQGGRRVQRRRRRQGQRRDPGERRRAALQGGRRGRQPRPHPARPDRVRAQRRSDQHRLHRQLGGGRHLRPRGQHQDPARSGHRGGRHDPEAAQRAARVDDGRGRGARPRPTTTSRTSRWRTPSRRRRQHAARTRGLDPPAREAGAARPRRSSTCRHTSSSSTARAPVPG